MCRDYVIEDARCGGYKVRHRKLGLEVTATLDGRVCLVTYETMQAAVDAINATYRDPQSPSTSPSPEYCGMTAPESMPFAALPLGTPVHIAALLSFPEWSHWGVVVAVQADPGAPVCVRLKGGPDLWVLPHLVIDLRVFEGSAPRPRCALVDRTGRA